MWFFIFGLVTSVFFFLFFKSMSVFFGCLFVCCFFSFCLGFIHVGLWGSILLSIQWQMCSIVTISTCFFFYCLSRSHTMTLIFKTLYHVVNSHRLMNSISISIFFFSFPIKSFSKLKSEGFWFMTLKIVKKKKKKKQIEKTFVYFHQCEQFDDPFFRNYINNTISHQQMSTENIFSNVQQIKDNFRKFIQLRISFLGFFAIVQQYKWNVNEDLVENENHFELFIELKVFFLFRQCSVCCFKWKWTFICWHLLQKYLCARIKFNRNVNNKRF